MKADFLAHYFTLHRKWTVAVLLAMVVCAGALLRLDGLDAKTLTHPEAYVPGITLPDGISTPPPRLTLHRLLYFHFHDEPHPQGYYIFMWVWTKLFGTSLNALRLPSVLFGVGSIILIFWVAAYHLRSLGRFACGRAFGF
ncbi:MAG: hypothetical protein WKF84_22900 [Pyrinomonadaceae bacterium]